MCSAATFCDSFEVYNLKFPSNRYKNDKLLYTITKDTEIWHCYYSTVYHFFASDPKPYENTTLISVIFNTLLEPAHRPEDGFHC